MSNIQIDHANPWMRARERYLATLTTDEERNLFTHASLENLFYTTSVEQNDHRENSKSRAFVKRLGPFLEAIEDYGKALDVFSNASSVVMCPLWGGIRVLLHIASEFEGYFSKLVEMLVIIGDYLPGMRVYEKIFKGHPDLLHSLSEVYLDIIIFCMDASKVFKEIKQAKVWSAPQARIIWRPFKRQFGKVVDSFRRHKANVERGASVSHMIEAASERTQAQLQRAELNAIQKGTRQAQLLQYLSSVDHQSRHRQLRKKRHENTGNWIFANEKFVEWMKRTESCLLWCHGIPGSGKSIITTTVVDELFLNHAYNSSAVVYFYCDYSNQKTLKVSEIFGSFIRQLLSRIEISDEIQSKLKSAFQDGMLKPDSDELLDVIFLVLKSFSSVFFILDGIDECGGNDRVELLAGITSILKPGPTAVKFFLASRADVDLERAFSSCINLPISTKNVTADIVSFVDGIVKAKVESRDLVVRNPSLVEEIADVLVKGAQGMFIWVTFQIDDICDENTDNGIRRVLHSLPVGLAETYTRALKKISEKEAIMAQKIFKWMVCAKRPLSMDEIKEAISISPLDKYLDQYKITTDDSRIIKACANLVVFDRDEGSIRFAHYSVQEFLLADGITNIHFCLSDAEHEVGEICVTYLSFNHFERQVVRQGAKDESATTDLSFLESSRLLRELHLGWCGKFVLGGWARLRGTKASQPRISINWGEYLRHTRTPPSPNFERQYRLLNYVIENWTWHTLGFSVANTGAQLWTTFIALALGPDLPFSFRPWGEVAKTADFPHMPLVLWALDAGHATLLRLLLEPDKGPDLHTYLTQEVEGDRSSLLATALHRSAQKGHVEVVKLLLECGADHGSRNNFGDTPLHAASLNGNEKVAKLLLETGADPHATNDSGSTALYQAASGAHYAVAELLLDHHADPNAKRDDSGETALHAAASSGHYAVVELLINHHVDLNAKRNDSGDTALHVAVSGGHDTVIKLLLDRGADSKAENNSRNTALYEAARGKNEVVVKLLIERGADGRTELYQACKEIDNDVIKLLIECGVNRNAELYQACEKGHTKTVSLLLEYGATLNVRGKGEALILAARGGHVEVVKLLLDHHANPNAKGNDSGETALHAAASGGHYAVVELLLYHHTDLNAKKSDSGDTALHVAVSGGHGGVTELLLDRGADPKAENNSRNTVLYEAACGRNKVVVKLLTERGVNGRTELRQACQREDAATAKFLIECGVNGGIELGQACRGEDPATAKFLIECGVNGGIELRQACRGGDAATAKLLIGYGVNPNPKYGPHGRTVLHDACFRGHDAVVKLLLKCGMDQLITDDTGDTPLHNAAFFGSVTTVKMLLNSGANIETRNKFGDTPLYTATRRGNNAVVSTLLDSGADRHATNNFGDTAAFIATRCGYEEIIELLQGPEAARGRTGTNLSKPAPHQSVLNEHSAAELPTDNGVEPHQASRGATVRSQCQPECNQS